MSVIPVKNISSVPFERLKTTLLASLPGAGSDTLSVEMANTFQAFCRETHVWRERIERNLVANQQTYELSPSMNSARVTFIIYLTVDGRPMRPLGGDYPSRDSWGGYIVKDDYKTIELSPSFGKNVPKGLKAVVALAPNPDNLDLPCEIIEHYFEPLRDGVLERMLAHVSKPYSNAEAARQHQRKFHAAVTQTRREVRAGNAQVSPPWRFPQITSRGPSRGGSSYGW